MVRVLVVDDEEPIRFTLRQMLVKAGHEVLEAANGRQAIEIIEQAEVDLVITDIVMPEKEGIETILEIRQRAPNLKIIAISGGGRTENMDYLTVAKRLGADNVLAKPFSMQEILEVITRTLGSAG